MDAKVVVWITASVSLSFVSWVAYSLATKAKARRDRKNFSNPKYSIGAAIVNMERATVYGEGENFKFFARYAIRTCLGMQRAYPPDEPPPEDVSNVLANSGIGEDLIKRTMDIYLLDALPSDAEKLKGILASVQVLVNDLLMALN
ncbi:MAG: hypothetical protein LBI61_02220 [Puniceicoccales bacterium]|jgi:hypothetical protein|nr:hypothetical protein [Puniceicoccales bacterium]